ncbi:MATE family efflux transporter [Sphingomonas sp. 35-24ZXX]|uniref:MATE family efflux transporter n=1 Tax=Sphingomonas sp. 35-24ZXX TaxID=1545915 RepID=UPI00053BE6B5|nr:MATE family efflux transporter [Sphingomonas sp. 35-24ZXX]
MQPDALDNPDKTAPQSLLGDAVPMVVSRVGLALMGLTDIVLLSRHDSGQLAQAALLESSFGRGLDIAIAFTVSALPLMAAAFAAGGMDAAIRLWRRAMLAAAVLGLVLIALSPFAAGFLTAWGQPAKLIPGTAALFPVAALGGLAGLLAIACAVCLEGTGRAATVSKAVLCANAANLALDLWLIGGGAGVPALGAMGAVMATAIVRGGLFVALAVLLHRHWRSMQDNASKGGTADPGAKRQRSAGFAAMAIAFTMHIFGMTLTMLAGRVGAEPLAVYCACWALNLPVMIVVSGLGDALSLRVGRNRHHPVMPDFTRLAAIVALPALALAVGAPWVASVYAPHGTMATSLAALLPYSAAVMGLDGLSLLLLSIMRGRQIFVAPAVIQATSMALAVPLGWWLAFGQGQGLAGIVHAIVLTSFGRLVAMGLCLMATASTATARSLQHQPAS